MSQSACLERTTESAGFRRPSREDGERVQRAGVKTVSVGLMTLPPMQWSVPNSLVRPCTLRGEFWRGARSTDLRLLRARLSLGWRDGTSAMAMCVQAAGARTHAHVPRPQPLTNNGGATDTAKRTRTYDVRVFVRSPHGDSTFPLFRQDCMKAFSREFYLQSKLYFSIAICGCHL